MIFEKLQIKIAALKFLNFFMVALSLLILTGCQSRLHVREPGPFNRFLDPSGIEPVEAAYLAGSQYDPDKRSLGTRLLAATSFGGATPYLKLYRQMLKDQDPTVRTAAVRCLGRHGHLEDTGLLVKMLDDENVWVRQEAATALQRFHEPKIIERVREACLDDADLDVRMTCCLILAQYPTPANFDTLTKSLDDYEYSVVLAASHALTVMTGRDLGRKNKDPSAWLKLQSEENLIKEKESVSEHSDPDRQSKNEEQQSSGRPKLQALEVRANRLRDVNGYYWNEFPVLPNFFKRLGGAIIDDNLPRDHKLNAPLWSLFEPVSPDIQTAYPSPYQIMIAGSDAILQRKRELAKPAIRTTTTKRW